MKQINWLILLNLTKLYLFIHLQSTSLLQLQFLIYFMLLELILNFIILRIKCNKDGLIIFYRYNEANLLANSFISDYLYLFTPL